MLTEMRLGLVGTSWKRGEGEEGSWRIQWQWKETQKNLYCGTREKKSWGILHRAAKVKSRVLSVLFSTLLFSYFKSNRR